MKIAPGLIAPFLGLAYRVWTATLRITERNRSILQNDSSMIFCCWHDELFAAPVLKKDLDIVAIVSRSRDGEYLSRLLQSLGLETARGSSSRGGASALIQTARYITEKKRHACVTVDGPRGPRHEIKDGVFFLARHASAPLVPFRVFYSRARVFNSWDRFQLPWPFSRVCLVFGSPYMLSCSELSPENLALERDTLKKALDSLSMSTGAA